MTLGVTDPGRAWVHDLDVKLREAGRAGHKGVEMFWEDLVYPLVDYEGLLDGAKHDEFIVKVKLWLKVVKILGTDLIQIPASQPQPEPEGTTGDITKIVSDMKEVAGLGLNETPPIRFAYEALSWGAHLDRWEQVWDIVSKVDLPNFGTKPNMQYLRKARLFPCEEARGGYLPVEAVAKVLLQDMGFRGWISVEVFSRTMEESDPDTPRAHSERGVQSWNTLVQHLQQVVHS
ncbi:xylose isomerase-like protein [Mycena galericulata]|nr:xylose isomerase-like protein [Mycena galericulata]